jgi:TetR/AcrR family transcriptional regulator
MKLQSSAVSSKPKSTTRIQTRNREVILQAALDVFSNAGFRGATLDEVASKAGLSKPNLLYYFPSKEALHSALLTQLLETWLDPLRAMNPLGEPLAEIKAYAHRKLELARDYPRESRLFANEMLQGAPRMKDVIEGDLRALVAEKAAVIAAWMDSGKIARTDPTHLIFSIWALTQHYADFDVQVRAVLGAGVDPFTGADEYLETLLTRLLRAAQDEGPCPSVPAAHSPQDIFKEKKQF